MAKNYAQDSFSAYRKDDLPQVRLEPVAYMYTSLIPRLFDPKGPGYKASTVHYDSLPTQLPRQLSWAGLLNANIMVHNAV